MINTAGGRVRVMLVDDHEAYRGALRTALGSSDWIELTAEAASGEQALMLLATECPDIVLMDFSLPGMNGLETTRRVVSRSHANVIGVSLHDRRAYAARLRRAGAKAWITKGGSVGELLTIIRRVAAGESFWDESPA